MSRGYYGRAKLIEFEGMQAEYSYSGENWNSSISLEGDALLYDGRIFINEREHTVRIISCKNEFLRGNTKYIATKLTEKISRQFNESGYWPKDVSFLI